MFPFTSVVVYNDVLIFIGSFEYHVSGEDKEFNGHLKWSFCILFSIRVMTLISTNMVASKLIKREKALLPVAVRHPKTLLNFICGNENVTHSAQSKVSWRKIIFLEFSV